MKRLIPILTLVCSSVFAPAVAHVAAGSQTTIRLASLAPTGSSWDKVFRAWSNSLAEKTGGAVKFQFFAGGIAGDERDVIRKIKLGQMDAGLFTTIGLGQIARPVVVLQMPGLYASHDQLDRVREKMSPEFEGMFSKEGYRLLGWSEAGFGRIFSKRPILRPEDYKAVRPWIPRDEPTGPEIMKIIGANGVPLGIPEVFPALQTGMVDTVLASAVAAVALQWFRYVTHVSKAGDLTILGATLLRNEVFSALAPDHQKTLLETGAQAHAAVRERAMKEDITAMKTLLGRGIQEFDPLATEEQRKAWTAVNDQVMERLTGKLWSKDLLERVKTCAAGGACVVK